MGVGRILSDVLINFLRTSPWSPQLIRWPSLLRITGWLWRQTSPLRPSVWHNLTTNSCSMLNCRCMLQWLVISERFVPANLLRFHCCSLAGDCCCVVQSTLQYYECNDQRVLVTRSYAGSLLPGMGSWCLEAAIAPPWDSLVLHVITSIANVKVMLENRDCRGTRTQTYRQAHLLAHFVEW